jgi:hypothetical protein
VHFGEWGTSSPPSAQKKPNTKGKQMGVKRSRKQQKKNRWSKRMKNGNRVK